MTKRKVWFFCLSLFLTGIMISSSSVIRILGEECIINDNSQVLQNDKSSWFWPAVEVLSQTVDDSHGMSIAIDDNKNVHVAFNDDTNDLEGSGTDRDIFYMQWNAETKNWSGYETVSTESTSTSETPAIAVDKNGNVHVAWNDLTDILGAGSDRDVFYKRRSSSGSWTTSELVSTDSTATLQQISIAVDNQGNPSITWSDMTDVGDLGGSDADIFYNNLTLATNTWLGMTLVSIESDLGAFAPDVRVGENGDIHFTWYDYTNHLSSGTDQDIFYRKYVISEVAWSPITVISSESTSHSKYPSMAIDDKGSVHIVWEDLTDYDGSGVDSDIFYKYYDTQLSGWTTVEVVSVESTTAALYSDIAVDREDNVHVTWEDSTPYSGAGTDWDIIYKYKDSLSEEWSSLSVVSSEMTDGSYLPIIDVDGLGHVHFVWYDITDYDGSSGLDYDVFYRKFVGPPEQSTLYPISPDPSIPGNITIDWKESFGAVNYDIYRALSYIVSTSALTPVASVTTNTFVDDLNASGTYYYTVIASNDFGESDLSNIESVEILSPTIQKRFFEDSNWGEVLVIVGIVGAIQIILTVTIAVLLKPGSTPTKKKK